LSGDLLGLRVLPAPAPGDSRRADGGPEFFTGSRCFLAGDADCPPLGCPPLGCPPLGCPLLGCPLLGCPLLGCPLLGCPLLLGGFLDARLSSRRGVSSAAGRRLSLRSLLSPSTATFCSAAFCSAAFCSPGTAPFCSPGAAPLFSLSPLSAARLVGLGWRLASSGDAGGSAFLSRIWLSLGASGSPSLLARPAFLRRGTRLLRVFLEPLPCSGFLPAV
jgi:hypothetical protein